MMLLAAFVRGPSCLFQPTTITTRNVISSFTTTQRQTTTPSSTTVVVAAAAAHHRAAMMTLIDPTITDAAIGFFTRSQLPAILITGLSLMGLFSMTENVNNTYGLPKLQIILLRLYHLTSLLSFCLSLSSIVTSTTATTLFLLSEFSLVSVVDGGGIVDVYHFLKSSNLKFEFLYTRWAFLSSIISSITSTTIRMILQFELFKPKRRLARWSVISTMTGFIAFIIGYINNTQNCWPSFWGLTKEVSQVSYMFLCLYTHKTSVDVAFIRISAVDDCFTFSLCLSFLLFSNLILFC
ncbi:MAG: hypothetical protein ACI90V_011877 [Bacillariaceae sp.]|jgi:hypothetical protein